MFNKLKKQITLIFSLTLIAICIGGLNKPSEVTASAGQNVSGWAWGEAYVDWSIYAGDLDDGGVGADVGLKENIYLKNLSNILAKQVLAFYDDVPGVDDGDDKAGGMGWLSFNCSTAPYGCAVDYGVNIDMTTGLMTGNAWSENYGWVKFDAGCPAGTTGQCSAKLDLATNELIGFAKVLSGDDVVTDGFDGWISLNDSNDHNFAITGINTSPFAYGISYAPATGVLSGYAWGSVVTGWIQFTDVHVNAIVDTGSLKFVPTTTVPVSITGLPNTITVPAGPIVLNWNSPDGTVYNNCIPTSSPTNPTWNSTIINATAANLPPMAPAFKYKEAIPLVVGTGANMFTIQCFPADGGAPTSATAIVNVDADMLPPLDLYIAGTTNTIGSVFSPYEVDLSWKSDSPNFNPAVSCTGSQTDATGVVIAGWDADAEAVPTVAGTYYTEYGMNVPNDPTYFKITCTATNGTLVSSNLVIINKTEVGEPSVTFTGSCTESVTGLDPYVSWSSSDAVSCDPLSGVNFDTGGDTSGYDSVATLTPSTSSYTYEIKCENDTGSDIEIAEVWYLPPGKSCTPTGCDPDLDPTCTPCDPAVDPWCTASGGVRPIFNEQRQEDINP